MNRDLVSSLRLGIVISSIALMGFGCKPGWNDPLGLKQAASSPTFIESNPVIRTASAKQYPVEPKQAVVLIQAALKNFDQASSFRTSVHFPTKGGYTTASLEVDKKKGVHGTLQAPGPINNEMYVLNNHVFFRTQGSDWADLSNTPEGQQVQTLMGSIFQIVDQNSSQDILSDVDQITDILLDRSGCTLVVFRPRIAKDPNDSVSICVKGGRPTEIIASSHDGTTLDARYWDYGTQFSFAVPSTAQPVTPAPLALESPTPSEATSTPATVPTATSSTPSTPSTTTSTVETTTTTNP